jgi:hypothetical protein
MSDDKTPSMPDDNPLSIIRWKLQRAREFREKQRMCESDIMECYCPLSIGEAEYLLRLAEKGGANED